MRPTRVKIWLTIVMTGRLIEKSEMNMDAST